MSASERYSKVPRHAFGDDRLTRADLRVLGTIGAFLDKDNESWPSQRAIAERAAVTVKTVSRAVRKLKDHGYLTTQQRVIAGMNGTLRYKVEFGHVAPVLQFPKNAATADGTEMSDLKNKENHENPSNGSSDISVRAETSDETSGCPSAETSVVPARTTHTNNPSSVPNGTGADASEGNDGDASPLSSSEIKKAVIWATGRTLLASQGMAKEAAGNFIGKLIKDCGLNAVYFAFLEAAKSPPLEAKAWLHRVSETEAKRTGAFKGKKTAAAAPETNWPQVLKRWLAGGAWSRELGEPPTSPEYRGPEDALEAVLAQVDPNHPTRVDCERARAQRQRRTA